MNFLLDDSLGLDTVKQFCKGGFNVLTYVTRHHKKEQIIARLEQAFLGLGNDGKNSRLFFHIFSKKLPGAMVESPITFPPVGRLITGSPETQISSACC